MGQLGRSKSKGFVFHPLRVGLRPPPRPGPQGLRRRGRQAQGQDRAALRDLKRGFLSEADLDPPEDVGELNRPARWLERYLHAVAHGTTGRAPAERFETERHVLGSLPPCASTPRSATPVGSGASPSSSGTRSFTRPRPRSPARSQRCASPSAIRSSSYGFWARWWRCTIWRPRVQNPNGCPSTRPKPRPSRSGGATSEQCGLEAGGTSGYLLSMDSAGCPSSATFRPEDCRAVARGARPSGSWTHRAGYRRHWAGIGIVVIAAVSLSSCSTVHAVTGKSYVGSMNVSGASDTFNSLDRQIAVSCARSVTQRCRQDIQSQIARARALQALPTNSDNQTVLRDLVRIRRDIPALITLDMTLDQSSQKNLQDNLSNQQDANLKTDLEALVGYVAPSSRWAVLWVVGILGVLAVLAAPALSKRLIGRDDSPRTTGFAKTDEDEPRKATTSDTAKPRTQEELTAATLEAVILSLGQIDLYLRDLRDRRRDRYTLLIQLAGVLVTLYAVFKGVQG